MKPLRLDSKISRHSLTDEGRMLRRSPGGRVWPVVYAMSTPYEWVQWRITKTAEVFAMVGS